MYTYTIVHMHSHFAHLDHIDLGEKLHEIVEAAGEKTHSRRVGVRSKSKS